ncbi:MAG: hypothetical protein LBS31_03825 [Candidatus Adiutrix sp.]|nr:hypothetical protein [Candidatus Adiutrix sp.]
MTMTSRRVLFHERPERNVIFHSGRLYEPGARIEDVMRDPARLNSWEADLAAVGYEAETDRWRLVRDFGQSPLYYALRADGFAWSFTYAGLLDLLAEPEPDEAVLFDYLATHYRHIFRDPGRTFHRGVLQVPAGSYVDISSSRPPVVRRWLDLSHDPEVYRLGPDEATSRLMEIISDSVKKRVLAARRPAFTISSGLDSGAVTSLAAAHLDKVEAFSVGYAGEGVEEFDETWGVNELTRGRDWKWTHLVLERPDLVGETRRLIARTKSPVTTVTWLAYFLMAEKLNGFEEMFNGLGGDESLAGEFTHFFYFFADLKKDGDDSRLAAEVEGWSRLHDHPVFRKNWDVLTDFWRRNLDLASGEMRVDRNVYQANWRFFEPQWLKAYGDAVPPMPRPYPNFLSNRLYQEINFETTPPTLWGLWRANEALGLRGVAPFMSPRLFKLCLSLPGTVKYDNGVTKALLRRGLVGLLPESLRLNTRKIGFNAPIHQWFKEPGVRAATLEMLNYGPLARRGWLRPGAAEDIFREHEEGRANHMMLLWPLLNASLFLKD